MALNLPGIPNFNVQQPDLLGAQKERAQLSNMLSETALRQSLAPFTVQEAQQKVQQETMANELQRIALNDSRIVSDYFKTGDAGEETPSDFSMRDKIATYAGVDKNDPIMGFLSGLAKKGMSGQGLLTQAQSMIQKRTEFNKGTEELQAIQKNERLVWQEALAALNALPEEQRSVALAAKIPLLEENSKSDPLLAAYAKGLAGHPELIPQAFTAISGENAALGLRRAQAEAGEAETKATEAAARATGAVTPQMKTEQAQKLEVATAEAKIHAQVQAAMLPLIEQIKQVYANQKDARDKIDSTVLKPYQEAQNNIEMAREMTAQAATNPVAARLAVFKLIGVAQPTGTHRVLPAEVEAAKFPGGLGTRVAEHISDFLNGKPWTPEIQQAVQEVINGQDLASKAALNTGIGNANKLYGTNVGTGLQQSVSHPGSGVNIPAVGAVEDGYRFKGGDPSKASNWEKVKK